jgi:L-ascorbate metabolism protein UlaG (beta-lactamase superfamily)
VLISHAHYDHCDLDAFAAFRDKGVPMVVPSTVLDLAHAHGFADVTALDPWEHVEIGDVTITATPAKHGMHEITFVPRSGAAAVYFAGDTLFIPELQENPERLGHISVALLPTNGLRIVAAGNMQVSEGPFDLFWRG